MPLKFFYTDYCEGKSVQTPMVWPGIGEILHSMDCVLHMPDNFCGIVNNQDQTLQFMVEKDRSLTLDIPILNENGEYVGSYTKSTSLRECFEIVRALDENTDFLTIEGLVRTYP
jgi:hypothetical protein